MNRLLLLILFSCTNIAFGQVVSVYDRSGLCFAENMTAYNSTNGKWFKCISGEWVTSTAPSTPVTGGGTGDTQVSADWNAVTGVSLILNKPTVPTTTSQLTNNSGFLSSVPAQPWTSVTGKPTFATVATSGLYTDLAGTPPAPIPSISMFGVTLTNPKFVRANYTPLAIGTADVYTTPAGRRALIIGGGCHQSAGTLHYYIQVNISGTYYRVNGNVTINSDASQYPVGRFITEPGDVLALNMDAITPDLGCWLKLLEYDSTSPLFAARVIGGVTASPFDTTLYTVPTGKSAVVLELSVNGAPGGMFGTGAVLLSDAVVGDLLSYQVFYVPFGGTKLMVNALETQFSGSNAMVSGAQTTTTLNSGDSLLVNTLGSASTSIFMWVNIALI